MEAAYLRIGDGRVELVSPLGADTPVGRFLAKRGPGMHHVAFEVADPAALGHSRRAGAEVIDRSPARPRRPRGLVRPSGFNYGVLADGDRA